MSNLDPPEAAFVWMESPSEPIAIIVQLRDFSTAVNPQHWVVKRVLRCISTFED